MPLVSRCFRYAGAALAGSVVFLASFAGIADTREDSTPWKSIGPEGGYFPGIVAHPTKPNVVFGGGDDSSGIWKSTDGGESWRLVTEELKNATGWCIGFDPEDPDVMYNSDLYGRYPAIKSTDGGETWVESWEGITARRTAALAVDPSNPKRIYVGCGWSDYSSQGGIFVSEDAAGSWRRAGLEDVAIGWLAISPRGTVFAASSKGLYRSANQGESWEPVSNGLPAGQGIGGVLATPNGDVFASTPGPAHSVYRSTDDGQSWQGVGLPGAFVWDIVVEPNQAGQVMYCGTLLTGQGVAKTVDGGESWAPSSEGIGTRWIIGLDQATNGDLFCSDFCNQGIYRSQDRAKSWARSTGGLHGFYVTGMALDPQDSQRIIVTGLGPYNDAENSLAPVTWEGRFQENGETAWTRFKEPVAQTASVAIAPDDSGTILLGSFQKGVYLSRDGGATFKQQIDEGVWTAVAFDSDDSRTAIASGLKFPEGKALMARSADSGNTWDTLDVDFSASAIVSQPDSTLMWAATNKGVQVSEDDGASWSNAGLADKPLLALAIHPDAPEAIYVGGHEQLIMKSEDRGATWKDVKHPKWPEHCEVRRLAVDPNDPKRLYAGLNGAEVHPDPFDGMAGGVWMSPDQGATWQELAPGSTNDQVWALAVAPDSSCLYIGTYGAGVIQIDLPQGVVNATVSTP